MRDVVGEKLAGDWVREIVRDELQKLKIPATVEARIAKILPDNEYEVDIRNNRYSFKSRYDGYAIGNVVDIYCRDGSLTSGIIENQTITP